jgi:uncharacterized membrane protein YqgA involved in biofilm formation
MSIAAFLRDSQVLVVVPKALAKGDIIGKIIGKELRVSTISDRMNVMFNHDDAFIERDLSYFLLGPTAHSP